MTLEIEINENSDKNDNFIKFIENYVRTDEFNTYLSGHTTFLLVHKYNKEYIKNFRKRCIINTYFDIENNETLKNISKEDINIFYDNNIKDKASLIFDPPSFNFEYDYSSDVSSSDSSIKLHYNSMFPSIEQLKKYYGKSEDEEKLSDSYYSDYENDKYLDYKSSDYESDYSYYDDNYEYYNEDYDNDYSSENDY